MLAHVHTPQGNLLGVQCLICSLPLTDAKSAEIGIGPVCRKKWGALDEIPGGEPARKLANSLIYQATVAKRDGDIDRVLEIATELRTMGLVRLADRVGDRFVELKLTPVEYNGEPWHDLVTPYKDGLPFVLKRCIPAKYLARVHVVETDDDGDPVYKRGPGHDRSLGGKFAHWCVHDRVKRLAMAILVRYFPGQRVLGGKGVTKLPTAAEFDRVYIEQALTEARITAAQAADLRAVFTAS